MGSDPIALLTLGLAAACGALALFLAMSRRPRIAMAVWAAALFFTPVWLGAQVGIFFTGLAAVTVLVILSSGGRGVRWCLADTIVLLLFLALLAALILGALWGHLQVTLTTWFLPYIWGRLAAGRVGETWVAACIATAASVAAALAIVEFVTSYNVFLTIPGASQTIWGTLQIRAGRLRAEGAFGHSIALGCSLAISSAFVLVLRWPIWLRALLLGLISVATALTFSRIGLVGLVLTVVLAVVFLRRSIARAMRLTVLTLLGVGVLVGLPTLLQVFGEAGAEAEGSAEYRAGLLPLVGEMVLLGVSPAREQLPTGEDYFGDFRSIDSALILIGLRHGLVPLALLIALLIVALVAVVRGRGGPGAIALAAQIPALATVALITQYAAFVWFVAGLAVASYSLGAGRPGSIHDASSDRPRELTGAS